MSWAKTTLAFLALLLLAVQSAQADLGSMRFIHADDVHAQGIKGRGVTVVVIDDGIFPEYIDEENRAGGISFVGGKEINDGGVSAHWYDDHGTNVAYVIVGYGGVARDAKIYSIRAVGEGCTGWDLIRAIEHATERKKADPSIRVINLSCGFSGYTCHCDLDNQMNKRFAGAIWAATDDGIIVFAATGNDASCEGINLPACITSTVKVCAEYEAGVEFAQYDVCADAWPPAHTVTCVSDLDSGCDKLLAAPGHEIDGYNGFPGYGTSLAAPHAAGVAALMFSKNGCGGLDAWFARSVIYNTASDDTTAFPYCAVTPMPKHLNALAAVNAVARPTTVALGDLDCDGTVSGGDFKPFLDCMTGPSGGPVQGFCVGGDFPESPPDGDVDLRDFAYFQLAFTGYGEGACCHYDGSCSVMPVNDCAAEFGATYQGHGTTCVGIECPLPNWGACCDITTQACTESSVEDCVWGNGFYLGDGTECATAVCPTARYHNVIDPLTNYLSAGPGLQVADDIILSGSDPAALAFYNIGVFGGGGGSFDVTVGLYTNCPGLGGTLIAGTERTFTDNPDYGSPVFLSATFNPPIYIPNSFWIVLTFSNSQAGWFRAEQAEIGYTADMFARNDPPWACNYWYGGPPNPYAGFWADIGCVEPQGACCHADLSCIEVTQAQCVTPGDVYQGPGTVCAVLDCSVSQVGACCDPDDASCTAVTQSVCTAGGGMYQGNGTTCGGVTCPYGRYRNEISPVQYYYRQGSAMADDMTLAGTGARQLEYCNLLVYGAGGGTFNVTASLYTACPGQGGTLIAGTTVTWNGIPDDGWAYLLESGLSGGLPTIPTTVWMVVQFSTSAAGWFMAGPAEVGSTADRFGINVPPWGCNYSWGGNPYAGFWANLRCVTGGRARSGGEPKTSITPIPLEVLPIPVDYQPGEFDPPPAEERLLDPRPVGSVLPLVASAPRGRRGTGVDALSRSTSPTGGRRYTLNAYPAGGKGRSPATVTLSLISPSAGQAVQPGEVVQWSVTAAVSQGDNAGLALVVVDLAQDASNPQLFDLSPAAVGVPKDSGSC